MNHFICSACRLALRRQRAAALRSYYQKSHDALSTAAQSRRSSTPLRLAIIGSGPAGFYAATRVLQKIPGSIVEMYEQLPTPFGLVRYGVAPDHPEVKNCQDRFDEVAESDRFHFIGNIAVGTDLPLTSLREHYHAILFAYGASEDKKLGIEGEDLKGIYSARAFVGWYNGLPEYAELEPDLSRGREAVIIGQGNVAMDVARILLSGAEALKRTDITEYALEALAKSRIEAVHVVGRRGPAQAAFTIKEVRELLKLPGVGFLPVEKVEGRDLLSPQKGKELPESLPRGKRRLLDLLKKGSQTPLAEAQKRWSLQFCASPKAFHGSKGVESVSLMRNSFGDNDPFDLSSRTSPVPSSDWSLPANVAFRSVGYKSSPLPGLSSIGVPFDADMGIIPNDVWGRVISPSQGPGSTTAGHVPGMYCAGWVKRGPTGVIATTMEDAFASADIVARDWEHGVRFIDSGGQSVKKDGWGSLRKEAEKRGLRRVSWKDWKRIDEAERERGRRKGKERVKMKSVQEMLEVLDGRPHIENT